MLLLCVAVTITTVYSHVSLYNFGGARHVAGVLQHSALEPQAYTVINAYRARMHCCSSC
jgi:hypothetical protein